ncbi:MAG: SDR family NAD(P)-dependent oxidoreductase, partial [Acidobacteriota bacterium]|nr:SDR family NAD(P)-dependent oxidoreductase [Acidobacteriota bacterium]
MPDSQPLTAQVALVTGGTRGIGRAVAAFFLDAGIQVVLTGTNRQAAEETAAQLAAESPTGALAHGAACDVTDDASVAELA